MAQDPDNDSSRLERHRRLHSVLPPGHHPPLSADSELLRWLINNVLNESQLDLVPPGRDLALRFLSPPRSSP